ncbi:MAG TPA: hypothetical protein VKX17_17695 [Planctomycetota bacterium]|nr:hypothetical protein [Planctomycetota bacterium]
MPMKEMIIAGSVLGAILVIALVVWKIKSGEVNQKKSEENARTEIRERNFKLAEDELPKAITAGTNFVIGKDPITAENEDKLFTSFKNNPKIYNVIYTHQFVDRRKPDETQDQSVAMIKDIDHTRKFIQLQNANTVKEEQDQKINYALATENGLWIPVVMARREIKTKPPDKVNPGGWIMVIVRAESDETFAKAIAKQEPPKSEPETKPADTTKPTDSTKPADTKDKSAPEIKEKPVDKKE